jgi:phosphoserine phosphatase RsbU/P
MLLGAVPDSVVEAGQVRLEPNDRLLLYTDGLSEAFNKSEEEYGENRVEESLSRAHALAPLAAVERLIAEVQAFCGSEPAHDDMTLMLVTREPS